MRKSTFKEVLNGNRLSRYLTMKATIETCHQNGRRPPTLHVSNLLHVPSPSTYLYFVPGPPEFVSFYKSKRPTDSIITTSKQNL